MDNWMRNNPGKRITIYDIPSLVTTAHNSSLTPKNIKSGFEKAGIFPFNSQIFSDCEFSQSFPTDIGLPLNENCEQNLTSPRPADPPECETYISPSDIRPLPKAERKSTPSRGRKRGKSTVLTSTPTRNAILKEKEEKGKKTQARQEDKMIIVSKK